MYSHKYSESAPVCLHGAHKIMQLSGIVWHNFIDLCGAYSGCHLGICSLLIQHSSAGNCAGRFYFLFPFSPFFPAFWGLFIIFPCPFEILNICELCRHEERQEEVGSQRCRTRLCLFCFKLHLHALKFVCAFFLNLKYSRNCVYQQRTTCFKIFILLAGKFVVI